MHLASKAYDVDDNRAAQELYHSNGWTNGLQALLASTCRPNYRLVSKEAGYDEVVAQIGEQGCSLAAGVLVDAVQANEGIEHEQPWLQPGDGFVEPAAVGVEIEAQGRGGDHLHVEIDDRQAGGSADSIKPATDDVQCVLGGIYQDATGPWHAVATQTGGAGGDGDGQIEGEEGFTAFEFAADDADGLLGPQRGDQPPLVGSTLCETMGGLDGQWIHRRRPDAAVVVWATGGTAKISVRQLRLAH
jgi:hypothetical protein